MSKNKKAQEVDDFSASESSGEEELIIGDQQPGEQNFEIQKNDANKKTDHNFIHLRFQQRNTRKCLTLVQGLPNDLDAKKIERAFKKAWCCNGTTVEHEEWGTIIQLQGDHRKQIQKFFVEEGIASKEQIKIHGY